MITKPFMLVPRSEAEEAVKHIQMERRLRHHKYELLKATYEAELAKTNRMNRYLKSLIDFPTSKLNYEHDFIMDGYIYDGYVPAVTITKEEYVRAIPNLKIAQFLIEAYTKEAERVIERLRSQWVRYMVAKGLYELKEWTKRRYGVNPDTNLYLKMLKFLTTIK